MSTARQPSHLDARVPGDRLGSSGEPFVQLGNEPVDALLRRRQTAQPGDDPSGHVGDSDHLWLCCTGGGSRGPRCGHAATVWRGRRSQERDPSGDGFSGSRADDVQRQVPASSIGGHVPLPSRTPAAHDPAPSRTRNPEQAQTEDNPESGGVEVPVRHTRIIPGAAEPAPICHIHLSARGGPPDRKSITFVARGRRHEEVEPPGRGICVGERLPGVGIAVFPFMVVGGCGQLGACWALGQLSDQVSGEGIADRG